MIANLLTDEVQIRAKVNTQTPTGNTVVRKPVSTEYARVIPLDTKTILSYQKLQSQVSHKMIFREGVDLDFDHEIIWKDKTLRIVEPAIKTKTSTIVIVKEI